MEINGEGDLRSLYGFAKGRSKDKQLSSLEKHANNFIAHSPFVAISTYSENGLADCSPRGGAPGFVKVIDQSHLVIPDAKGNNRLDSIVNILHTGGIGCLFLIPGVDETLRVNGTARISSEGRYLDLFVGESNPPKTCIEVTIKEVFLHCAKALMRSKLWDPEAQIDRADFPTIGTMLRDQLSLSEKPESQEEMVKRYQKDL